MTHNREPLDLSEVYGPKAAEEFQQRIHGLFECLEAAGRMPEEPRKAEVLPFPKRARHSTHGGTV